jgi:hypothetical protein
MNAWDDELFEILRSAKRYPKVDGHFWVKRDGKVIDPNFQSFNNLVCQTWNCEGPKIYLEAPKAVQTHIINLYKEANKSKRFLTWESFVERFCFLSHKCDGVGARMMNCGWINSILECHENGGEIVFGSMGWRIKASEEIHFEFGGANFVDPVDFLRN